MKLRTKVTRPLTGFDWADVLMQQIRALNLEPPVREYKFDAVRKWRFDAAWPHRMLAVEIAGAEWTQGRHSRQLGKDFEKTRAAVLAGWHLYPFVGSDVRSGLAIDFLSRLLT